MLGAKKDAAVRAKGREKKLKPKAKAIAKAKPKSRGKSKNEDESKENNARPGNEPMGGHNTYVNGPMGVHQPNQVGAAAGMTKTEGKQKTAVTFNTQMNRGCTFGGVYASCIYLYAGNSYCKSLRSPLLHVSCLFSSINSLCGSFLK